MSSFQIPIDLFHIHADDNRQHIFIADQAKCRGCSAKPCLSICPSQVFTWNYLDNDPVLMFYKQCIECGACRLICPFDNISFSYPDGGYGVSFRDG